jgi:hypothetical protein
MSLVLNDYINPKLGKVYHLKGHGGIYGAIRHVKNSLAENKFIFKNEKNFIGKIAKGFDFCWFRLSYNKIILAKSCLAIFEKRLSKLYEQLLKSKRSSYKIHLQLLLYSKK